MKPKAGDRVRITTSDNVFEGFILPRPDLLSSDVVVLKLKTGYNIGIDSKKIRKIEVVEPYSPEARKKHKISKKKNLPVVAIVSTGGTIASRIDYRTGGVYADYTADDFVAMCPELLDIANIETVNVSQIMSEDIQASDWVKIAKEIAKIIGKVDGVVVTHGTDTMHFTSSALSFLLKDLGKPVVLTGAQRSIDRGSSDAFINLICAVTTAARWDGSGVVVCMHGSMNDDFCHVIRGTKVRKMHTSRRDAFRPINDEPLACVFADGRIEKISENYPKRSDGKTSVRSLDSSVSLIYAYPEMDPGVIDYHIKKGVKGIVIAATALGHVALNNEKSLEPYLKKAVKAGIPVFITSQTLYGRVHPHVYTNLRRLSLGVGAVYLSDMLPETAYVKLMVALKEKNPVDFMTASVAGEITDREIDDYFLI